MDFLPSELPRTALRLGLNKLFIFVLFFDLSELLFLGQTPDFPYSYILFTIFIHMFNQGLVSPSGGSLASFFLSCSRKNLAPHGSLCVGRALVPLVCVLYPIKGLPGCCFPAIPPGIPPAFSWKFLTTLG